MKAVRMYLETMEDNVLRIVCNCLMRGVSDREICRAAHIDADRLGLLKLRIAIDVRKAGALPEKCP